ncbi:MAG: type II toxin-antitoxin system VapC family toxin [Candidatus Bathyarchaeia archaeon]
MNVQSVYLDTSALIKRYVVEEHSDQVDELYGESHAGRAKIGFSIWNIGEVAVVLDKYGKKGIVKDGKTVFTKFIGETRLLVKLGQLRLVPISSKVVIEAVNYVFKHGIYIADAIQLTSAREFDAFLTYDRRLAQVASAEGFKVIEPPQGD